MRIAVIGSGNVGGTLGRRWATLGHDVVFGVRDPKRGAAAVKGAPARAPFRSCPRRHPRTGRARRRRVARRRRPRRHPLAGRRLRALRTRPWRARRRRPPRRHQPVRSRPPPGVGTRRRLGRRAGASARADGTGGEGPSTPPASTTCATRCTKGAARSCSTPATTQRPGRSPTSWRPPSASTPSMRVPSCARASSSTWRCSGSRSPWVSAGRRVMGGASRFG
ncbi:MAG: NAD(P)-binding domain-containing protein [Gemmatimonadetes bacterium]|nr:NAD(P)-binding domain-containing protein [Gemmatimonadota bacterium]